MNRAVAGRILHSLCSLREESRNEQLLPGLLSGTLFDVTEVIFALSLASLIFSGTLTPHLPYGIGMALVMSVAMLIGISLTSRAPGVIGSVQDSPSVSLGVLQASICRLRKATERSARDVIVIGLIALAAAFSAPVQALAQSPRPRFTHLTSQDGLSHDYIYTILQDRTGFMWFGTLYGLDRYDGYTFDIFLHRRSIPDSLTGNAVRALFEDATGTLWIGTADGLDSLVGGARFQHHPEITEQVNVIYQDRAGRLWVGASGQGLYRYDFERGEWRQYRHDAAKPDSLGNDEITALCEDDAGILWVGTAGGLDAFDPHDGRFRHYRHDSANSQSLSDDMVRTVYLDRAGQLWVGTGSDYENHQGGLDALDRRTGQFTHSTHDPQNPRSLSHDVVTAIYEDRAGMLWIGTSDGLNVLDRAQGSFTRYTHEPQQPTSLGSNRITALFEDRSGILWVGSEDAGLSRYARAQDKFMRYTADPSAPGSLTSPASAAVMEDHTGALWVGHHNGGLDRLDPATGALQHYRHDAANPTSLSHDHVRALWEDRTGKVWVGSNGGLDLLDPEAGNCSHFTHSERDPTSLGKGLVRAILEDRAGELWIGLYNPGSLDRLDRASGTFIRYEFDPGDPDSFPNTFGVTALYEDRAGDLWIGTYDGLARFERGSGKFVLYQHDPAAPTSLSHNFVWAVYEDTAGAIWVGTEAGLDRLDRSSGSFTVYTSENGLPNDNVKGILADKQGRLWLSTDGGGVSRLDSASKTFRNYGLSDGLAGVDAVVGVYHQGPSGRMYFGSMAGLTAFDPEAVADNPYIPPVVLTAFRKFDQVVPFDRPLWQVDAIQLSYQDNFFSFEFAALDYTDPAKNRYAYRLEGFDRAWVQSGTRRYASYTNLPPGTYTFRVKGSNNDGVWNEAGQAIRVSIAPPVWQTWWFRSLLGVLLAAIAAAAVSVRLRYVAFLRASEGRYRALFDNAPLCVCEVSLALAPPRIRRANRRTELIFGRSAAQIQDAGIDSLFPSHAWDLVSATFARMDTRQSLTVESCGVRSDGSEFPIRLNAAQLGTRGDKLMILMIEDLTSERERRSEEETIAEERRRIAREIHDGLAQDMAGLRFKVGQWRRLVDSDPAQMHAELDAFQQLLTRNLREIRRSIFALRPLPLAELGFCPALRQFLADFGEQNQLRIDLRVIGPESCLPSHLEPVFFRIIQESVNNVGKHAQATTIRVTLDLTAPTQVHLSVCDDGIGFDPAQLGEAAAAGHLGLKQIQERVAGLHGTVRVESQPGVGTTISVSLPGRGASS